MAPIKPVVTQIDEKPCANAQPAAPDCCNLPNSKPDYLLIVSGTIVLLCYLIGLFSDASTLMPQWLFVMSDGIYELMNKMWLGLVVAVVFVGLLDRVPREIVTSALGQGQSVRGIFRATLAGLLLDLCNHGILMVGCKLYERGASLGQVIAFLIASPWNSLSLTIILVALIGLPWTIVYIVLSLVIGLISGLIFDALVVRGSLPDNPARLTQGPAVAVLPALKKLYGEAKFTPANFASVMISGFKDARMVFRWVFFGLVVATAIRAFLPLDTYATLFGPTMAGLLMTLVAATIIEVCSEGSTPIAADLVVRADAPGNGFTFLMAGIATDYTEIVVLRDLTKSWKIALFLPLVCVPQVLVLGWLLNQFAA
ncbi:MAG: permease [Pseudomonadales bacterium]|nr:permease [Pseudomonadales bacterium]